jgi:hypothetical protein
MAAKLAAWLRLAAEWLSPSTASSLGEQIEVILASPAYQPVLQALRKTNADRMLSSAPAEVKHAETLQWAEYYSTKAVARRDAWKTRFLLELLIGIEKGFLKR